MSGLQNYKVLKVRAVGSAPVTGTPSASELATGLCGCRGTIRSCVAQSAVNRHIQNDLPPRCFRCHVLEGAAAAAAFAARPPLSAHNPRT